MKYVFVFTLLIVAVTASPLSSSSAPVEDVPLAEIITTTPIPILRQELSIENGSFVNSFETGHGITVEETGSQKQIGSGSGTVSSGSFSFTNPEGAVVTVTWIANENGFQATGDHLPTPPPTPQHVVKMLADMEAALDAISIATESPKVVTVPEAPVVAASQDPLPVESAQNEFAAISPAAVESVPAEATPAEATPAEAIPVATDSAPDAPVESIAEQSVANQASSAL